MKILDIALKDMTRSFRSLFALIFMFAVPLLMAGMFYFMFGNQGSGENSYSLPVTSVVVANLDQGGPGYDQVQAQFPQDAQADSMGEVIVSILQGEDFADLMQVSLVDSAEAARAAVDAQQAGVAIIIPADFSAQFSDLSGQATLEFYQDPTLTLGPGVVQSILSQLTDSLSGARIAVDVALKQSGSSDAQLIGQVMQQYLAAAQEGNPSASLLNVQAPASSETPTNPVGAMIAMILGGMTIFYAFFTGASSAQSLLKEDEEGTLPRLFTTPTEHAAILGGKFLAIGLTVTVQMVTLLILGRFIFAIQWGALLSLSLLVAGTVLAASAFGIFLISLLKSTKQSGAVFGGVLTVTGMMGIIKILSMGAITSPWIDIVPLFVPQGWATRGLLQVLDGAALSDVALTALGLAVIGVVLFGLSLLRLRKRYA